MFEAYQAGAFTGNETIEHLYRRTLALCAETDSALEDQWDCFLEVVIAGWCATTIPGFPLSITTPSWPADRWFGEGLKELALEMERCARRPEVRRISPRAQRPLPKRLKKNRRLSPAISLPYVRNATPKERYRARNEPRGHCIAAHAERIGRNQDEVFLYLFTSQNESLQAAFYPVF